MAQKEKNIVINCYTNSKDEDDDSEGACEDYYNMLRDFLEAAGYCVDPNIVDLEKTRYGNIVNNIDTADHTISVVTNISIDKFFKEEEHFQVWLRSLHKALDKDNLLTHIIFCVDVDVKKVPWYLRQFNPCVTYSSKNNNWKDELLNLLKCESKSVKTLRHVNAGEALAWSHYMGFVRFLPYVCGGGNQKDKSVWKASDEREVIKAMVIVIPNDCHCPEKIEHPSIKSRVESNKYPFQRAGKKRVLNADLYELKGIDKLVPIGSTPSIETLRYLKEERGLDDNWLREQRNRYAEVLKDRTENDEQLRQIVILIDNYDSSITDVENDDDLVKVILRRIKEASQDQQDTEKKDVPKDLSVYLRSNKHDNNLAEEIQGQIQEAIPTLKIVNKHDRIPGCLLHDESVAHIQMADQCIFLLTEHKEEISSENEASACLDKILESDNKRAAILLYTKKAEDVHKQMFQLLAEHFVAKVLYSKDDKKWVDELKFAITDIQARPLKSAVNFHNIAEGLAFGYLYGYLNIFLPEFSEKMVQLEKFKKVSEVMPKKIIILMPKSGYSPKTLKNQGDTNLMELETKERKIGKIMVRVGCQERDFSVTEYSLRDETGKEYFVAAEFLTPLQTLTEMRGDIFADMSTKQKREQQRNLRKVMLEIYKEGMIPENLAKNLILLEIEDEDVDDKGKLTLRTDADKLKLYHQEILKTVKEELKHESKEPVAPVTEQLATTDIK